jgi:hypothetical protein
MTAKTAFDELADEHRTQLGVTYSITANARGPWSIMGLRNRGAKGNGAIALQDLCTLADEYGVTLALGTSIEKLKPYYEGFGFRPVRDFKLHGGTYHATFYERRP